MCCISISYIKYLIKLFSSKTNNLKKYCKTANKDFWGLKTDLKTLAVGEVGSLEVTYVAAGSKVKAFDPITD